MMPPAWLQALLVGFGGAIGAVLRWGIGRLAVQLAGSSFPWGTLAANLLGSFALGVLVRARPATDPLIWLLGMGLLGGFTTFSSFAVEVLGLWEREPIRSAIYIGLTIILGVLMAALGLWTGQRLKNF